MPRAPAAPAAADAERRLRKPPLPTAAAADADAPKGEAVEAEVIEAGRQRHRRRRAGRLPRPRPEEGPGRCAEWQDKFLRLHAEWDTYRRRTAEQREAEKARAAEKLVTSLLPVIDDFERTIDYADEATARRACSTA